jgi:hypothetical protein
MGKYLKQLSSMWNKEILRMTATILSGGSLKPTLALN